MDEKIEMPYWGLSSVGKEAEYGQISKGRYCCRLEISLVNCVGGWHLWCFSASVCTSLTWCEENLGILLFLLIWFCVWCAQSLCENWQTCHWTESMTWVLFFIAWGIVSYEKATLCFLSQIYRYTYLNELLIELPQICFIVLCLRGFSSVRSHRNFFFTGVNNIAIPTWSYLHFQ